MKYYKKNYGKYLCSICGREISLCGVARYNHLKKHDRERQEKIIKEKERNRQNAG